MRSVRLLMCVMALMTLVALAGCTALPPLPLPTVTPKAPAPGAPTSVVPEMTPTPTPAAAVEATPAIVEPTGPATVPAGCVADAGQALVSRPDDGYCLAYPTRFKVLRDEPEGLSIVGPALDESVEPVMATLTVTVGAAQGDFAASVQQAMAEHAGFTAWKIERLDVELGGLPAAVFEPVPGRLSGRTLFTQHAGKLYRLDFWPVDIEAAMLDVNELYNSVIASWQFIPAAPAVSIAGTVLWGEQPVPDATVQLRTPDWRTNPNSIVATTTADGQGRYEFKAPLSGRYEVVPAWAEGGEDAGQQGGIPVLVAPAGAVAGLDVFLARAVRLTAPAAGALVDASPVLQWEAVEGAVSYRVIVNDPLTMEGFFGVDVTGLSVKIDPPLTPGVTYAWVVNALTANQGLLGVGEGSFTVK